MTSLFVMAAGKGARLAPWTEVVPKPALPVANEPSLGFLLRLAARNGFRDIVANASWRSDILVGIFVDGSAHGVQLSWNVEEEPLGTAGGVIAAQDQLRNGDEPIIILSGDGIHDVDLAAVERAHRESGAVATLALLPVADASQYGVAVLDESARITGFQEKPARGTELSRLANTGIYVLQPEVLDRCVEWGLTDFGSELFPRMLEEGFHLHAHALESTYWNDIGDLDEWRASNGAVLEGRVEVGPGAWSDAADDQVLLHPTAVLGDGVQLTGPCTVGAGARIGDGAHLRSALVLPHAEVPSGAVVASGTIGTLDGLERWARELAGA